MKSGSSIAETIDVFLANRPKKDIYNSGKDLWDGAIGEDIQLLHKNWTLKFDSLPRGQKVLDIKDDVDDKYVSTHENPADMISKEALTNNFRYFLDLIGVCSTQWALQMDWIKEERHYSHWWRKFTSRERFDNYVLIFSLYILGNL